MLRTTTIKGFHEMKARCLFGALLTNWRSLQLVRKVRSGDRHGRRSSFGMEQREAGGLCIPGLQVILPGKDEKKDYCFTDEGMIEHIHRTDLTVSSVSLDCDMLSWFSRRGIFIVTGMQEINAHLAEHQEGDQ